ncbi:MAG: sigma-54-dependent Fis family transcriptional regulator [Magnetococcales bacterium]|nr:sigma-54-dependent Fis family transcriptional regulator [Magnetococcales bacterium]NGZ28411.1 sigma-54-dependent Fis family transcriptional regulator [Magnetococcales bacterium]
MSHSPVLQGRSPEFTAMVRAARLVAATDATVLLTGESGTGKELLAHVIHKESRRRHAPFVTINCAALPEALVESELFGHARGAFTGAVQHRNGRVQSAQGGTLFLDEIGETPLAIQAKLLRLLECGECQSLGEERPRRVDVRIVAATNRDLHALVEQGSFRSDLYFRLNVAALELPPLRQRQGDLELLMDYFFANSPSSQTGGKPRLSSSARKLVQEYPWPGNVRELRNFCERLAIFHPGETVEPHHLPREFTTPVAVQSPSIPLLSPAGISLESLEKELILQALTITGGNRTRAARLLDLSRDALLYRMKKHGFRE